MEERNGSNHSLSRFSVVALCALAIASSACKKEAGEKNPVVNVQTTIVQKSDFVQTIDTEATLFPIHQAAITPKVTSPVRTFFVNRGAKVHKGQLLAVLENRDLEAAAMENKGGFEQAEATYSSATKANLPEEWKKAELDTNAAKQDYEAKQKIFDNRRELYKQGALPQKDLNQAGVDLTQARNNYEVAEQHLAALKAVTKQDQLKSASGQLTAAKGKYMGATAQLGYTEIRSPIDGVISDRPVFAGETPASGVPLITVIDNSQVVARAHVPQEQAARIKLGDPAEITAPGEEKPFPGKVTIVSPATDPNSTTIEIWVQAPNPEGTLRVGTSVRLSIAVAKIKDTIVIPAESLVTSGEGATSVMVVDRDNHAHQKQVQVGARQADRVQILTGLNPGDQIVTVGAYGLPDNAGVEIQKPEEPGKDTAPDKAGDKKSEDKK
jgi:multidrug efflux pump subunit AcrA (membrane-fusion protein)